MTRYITLLLLTTLFLESCAPATASPTPLETATATQTIILSEAPSPTPTSIPQTSEHLIVTRDGEHWAVLNADGSLQKYIQIPDIAFPPIVSPDGNWLAYQLGAYENTPHEHSLNLINLEDGTSEFVTNLISPNFPKNIEPIVKSTFQYDSSVYGEDCADMECRRSRVENEVELSAGFSGWSPDGKFLAFTAQIDGPSTDIYVYSMQDKTIRRLTDDLQNVGRLATWSSDGKRLLYTNMIPGTGIDFGLFDRETFHITDMEGKNLQLTQDILIKSAKAPYARGWITSNLYLLQADYLGGDPLQFRQLMVLNVENGDITEIWPYSTGRLYTDTAIVINTDNSRIVLSFDQSPFGDPIPNAPEKGTYFISSNGEYEKISSLVYSPIIGSSQIIGMRKGTAYHIGSDGSIKRIGATDDWGWYNSSSPDKMWFFLDEGYDEEHNTVSLYNNAYQQIKSWVLDGDLIETTWRPDSLGIFLFTSDNIYYLPIPDGEPQLLDVKVPPCQWDPVACTWPSFVWRP